MKAQIYDQATGILRVQMIPEFILILAVDHPAGIAGILADKRYFAVLDTYR